MEMSKKERIKRSVLIIIIMVVALVSIISSREKRAREKKEKDIVVETTGNYNIDIIKEFNASANKTNYLLSPYNIEIALNMLREGADGKTKEELDKVLGNRSITDLSLKDKIGIANAVFIKDEYKNNVKKDFYSILTTKYHSEVIYDEFRSPDKINNWVKEKTNGMIEKILDQMSSDFVMGLGSALAIDVKWENKFECDKTYGEEFTKIDNNKLNVEMMHKTYEGEAKYLKTDEVEGIVIPYEKGDNSNIELEFIGLLPKDDVDSFINQLTKDKLDNILNSKRETSDSFNINLSLPRFKYDYDEKKFIEVLENIGIKEAFNPETANFKKMIEIAENVYVGEAIHKTHIELNESGTKAAAVTYFGMFKNSAMMPGEVETVDIKFNKPFVYMIREKNTGEILFFGAVYEPNLWNGSTCSKTN